MTESDYYLCVTPFFPSPNRWQGAFVLDQVKAIQRHSKYKVLVFKTDSFTSNEDNYVIDGVQVYSIRPLLMPSYFLNGLTENIVGSSFVKLLHSLGVDPQRVKYVHCHTASHSAFGFGVRRINPKTKVLVQFHDLDPYSLRNGFWADKRWNVRYRAKKSLSAFERADLLISISTPVQDNLLAFPKARPQEVFTGYLDQLKWLEDYPSLKSRKTYILYNGVDYSLFFPKTETKSPSGVFRIGCIANFQEIKDHITLIKAFEILIKKGYPDMRLSLLGSGETRSFCEQYISDNGLDPFVEWPKEMDHSKLLDYYHSLSLFVLPSVFEGFGCVYTEAHACGIPFMGVYNQGAAELIPMEDREKWLIQPHDYIRLGEIIEQYYKKREQQTLSCSIDINELVKDFLDYLETL